MNTWLGQRLVPVVTACMRPDGLPTFGRALEFGFSELRIANADAPLWAQDGQRCFVFMPLPAKATAKRGSRVAASKHFRVAARVAAQRVVVQARATAWQ
jgi:hypothetical protein